MEDVSRKNYESNTMRNFLSFSIWIFLVLNEARADLKEIICNRVEIIQRCGFTADQVGDKNCFFDNTTVIDSNGYAVSSNVDRKIKGFIFDDNSKVSYLPDCVNTKFPNLVSYSAGKCGIKSVSKRNFDGLNKLQMIFLYSNQIERIDDDTFEGLERLDTIVLSNNRIKFMNGNFIVTLVNLSSLDLEGNVCINSRFGGVDEIQTAAAIINEKCGFKPIAERIIEEKCPSEAFGVFESKAFKIL